METPIFSPTEEEKKEAEDTANKILGYFHELETGEKAYLLHVVVKKFSKLTHLKPTDIIKEKNFHELEDETNKN